MLTIASLMSSATTAVVNIFSPSRNACMKRVAGSRYRNDPYSARVLPSPLKCVDEEPLEQPVCKPLAQIAVPLPVEPLSAMSPQALKAPASVPRYAIVQFKQESIMYVAPFRVTAGDTVVVEGDRGENIGVVSDVSTKKPSFAVSAKILRRATKKDLEALSAQRAKEALALKATRQLAESVGLNASVEDVELQFDMNKLTVYVRRASKNVFVDFRKLQRGLFREFRCRIWLAYMDEVEAAQLTLSQ